MAAVNRALATVVALLSIHGCSDPRTANAYRAPVSGYYFLGTAVPLAATVGAVFGATISYAYTAPVVAVVYLLGCILVLKEIQSRPPASRAA